MRIQELEKKGMNLTQDEQFLLRWLRNKFNRLETEDDGLSRLFKKYKPEGDIVNEGNVVNNSAGQTVSDSKEEYVENLINQTTNNNTNANSNTTKVVEDLLPIGKNIYELVAPPPGYSFYTRANGKKWIRRIDATNPNTPRLTVKDGEITRFTGQSGVIETVEYVYHVKSDKFVQNVIDDIEPAFFGADNRFGQGFYIASEGETAIAEVLHHGGDAGASKVIRFSMDNSKLKILDLTDEAMAQSWKLKEAREFELAHLGEGKEVFYKLFQEIAQKAKESGYNSIRFNSFRNQGGVNYVILETTSKEFYKEVLKPQLVMPAAE